MKYPRIISAIRSEKWAMLPSTMQAIRDALAAHINGKLAVSDIPGRRRAYDDGGSSSYAHKPFSIVAPGVAVVEMCGIIGKNLSALEMDCGGCDLAQVESDLKLALAAPGVMSVILHIESPGGTVPGVGEFAAKIETLSMAAGKLVWAFVDGRCCSAAYWVACGCFAIIGTTSSDVGSIGVFMACVDESEAWAKEGYKLVLIKAGTFKGAGIPGSEVTDEQVAIWQADVNAIYSTFSGFVSSRRPAVTSESMQGQVFFGARAKDAGLVDEMVPDLEAMIAKITSVQPRN